MAFREYKRDILISILPAFVLSTSQVLGASYVLCDNVVNIHNLALYVYIVLFTFVNMFLLLFIGRIVEPVHNFLVKHEQNWMSKLNGRELWAFLIALLILWLPTFLALWPGNYEYDAPGRLLNYYEDGFVSAHHPVLHTLLMVGCVEVSDFINFGDNVAIILYSVIQSVIMAICIAYSLSYLWNNNVSKYVVMICLVLIGINPALQTMMFTTTHDILFGGVLLVVMVLLLDSVIHTERFFFSKKKMIGLSIMLFLMCMLRNQGIYMLVLFIPFAILSYKRYRIKASIILLLPMIITLIITGPLYSIFGVLKAPSRELLSVPIQQIAYVVNEHPESIEAEQYEELYKYIPKESLDKYNPQIADPVKDDFNSDEFDNNPFGFFKLWFDIGINDLTSYLTSFVAGGYGYYYLGDTAYYQRFIVLLDDSYGNERTKIGGNRNVVKDSKLPVYESYIDDMSEDAHCGIIPVVSQGLPFILIMILLYLLCLRKKTKELVLLILPFGYLGSLLLGPVIGIRYVFPLIIMVPLFVGMIFRLGTSCEIGGES